MLKKYAPFCIVALFLSVEGADGAVYTPPSAPFGPIAIDNLAPITVQLPKFDSNLGTLTSVKFTLNGITTGGAFAFDNEGSSGGNVWLSFGVCLHAQTGVSTVTTWDDTLFGQSFPGTVQGDSDAGANFSGTDSFTANGSGSNSTTKIRNTGLSDFIAPPNVSQFFPVQIYDTLTALVPGTSAGVWGPTSITGGTYSGNITVEYTYLLVPVPEAVGTLWGAAVGLFALSRRRRVREA